MLKYFFENLSVKFKIYLNLIRNTRSLNEDREH
jgi:hypothetical protein